MLVSFFNVRLALLGGLLLLVAACTSSTAVVDSASRQTGVTNAPAAGFANMQSGSEEDFILNVGRRTYFTNGSAALDSVAKATLDKQVAWLKQYPRWLVKVQGFADDPGSNDRALSQKRADAVMRYLVAGGIDARRVWAKGYGRERVVRDCSDTACRVQNRRAISNLREEYDDSAPQARRG